MNLIFNRTLEVIRVLFLKVYQILGSVYTFGCSSKDTLQENGCQIMEETVGGQVVKTTHCFCTDNLCKCKYS